jgi:hypothetical protein
MTHLRHALAVSLLATTFTFAADDKPTAAGLTGATPTTRPADADVQKRIDRLISELAADDFAVRERASRELEKLGKQALPALKEGTGSQDPSIQTYARALVERLEPSPDSTGDLAKHIEAEIALGDFAVLNGRVAWDHDFHFKNFQAGAIALGKFANARSVLVKDADRQILFELQGDGRITIDVSDDKKDRQHFEAASEAELKQKHPDAFKLYELHRNVLERQGGANFKLGAKLHVPDDRRAFRLIDNDRVVEIEQQKGDAGPVKVTLRDVKTDRIMQTFEANSPDELRRTHPEIGKLYDRFGPLMEGEVPILGKIPHINRLFVNKAQIRLHGPEADGADLGSRLEKALKEAGVSDDQRKQILDRLDDARRERPDQEHIVIEADPGGVR